MVMTTSSVDRILGYENSLSTILIDLGLMK